MLYACLFLWSCVCGSVYRYNIVDMKPDNMEDLTEVITSATYHPINSQLFMFSSSCGQLKLGDLRRSAICTEFKSFHESNNDPSKPFFSEIVASISDIKFSRDGRYAISRDYLCVRVWDLAMPHKAVRTISVNSNLQGKLIELYVCRLLLACFLCSAKACIHSHTCTSDHPSAQRTHARTHARTQASERAHAAID